MTVKGAISKEKDSSAQRIKKILPSGTRIFHYDLLGHLIAETNQSGTMLAEYIYLGDQLLVMIYPGELAYYYHNDHLGTPQILTDDSGTISWKAFYTPFGEAVVSVEAVENPFRFPGQYYDPETGLHYNYHRYYDPKTGRYLTPDPIGLEGGINLFLYVEGNPLNWIDCRGLDSKSPPVVRSAPRVRRNEPCPGTIRAKYTLDKEVPVGAGGFVDGVARGSAIWCTCYWKRIGWECVYYSFAKEIVDDYEPKAIIYSPSENNLKTTKGTWDCGKCLCLNPYGEGHQLSDIMK